MIVGARTPLGFSAPLAKYAANLSGPDIRGFYYTSRHVRRDASRIAR